MSQLIPFDASPVAAGVMAVPAHILAAKEQDESNIQANTSLPQLRFKGKVWSVDMGGQNTILTQSDGETPVALVKLVVMAANPARSRAYYEGAFDPDKAAAPRCYSTDGVRPDAGVQEPCARTCAECQLSKKGSKISDNGKATVACAAFKRLAVVPSNDLTFEPLCLRLPQTSIFDTNNAENEAKGWFAWDQYLKFLMDRGCSHTKYVVTAVKFDPREAYPKLLFKAEGWLGVDDLATINGHIEDRKTEIDSIVNGLQAAVPNRPAAATAPQIAAPAPQTQVAEEEEAPAAPAPAPAARAPRKTAPKAEAPAAPAPAPKAEAPAPVVETGTPAGLSSVLSSWDD